MNINLSISSAPTITQNIAIRIFKASNPSVVVSVQEFTPPHNSPRNVTFTNVDPVVYIINTYSTPGDPVLGTLLHSFIYNPEYTSADIKATEFLKMVEGDTEYEDPAWADFDIDTVFRVGFGPLFEPDQIEWILNVDNRVIGFRLSQPGDTFAADEQFTVQFYPKITTIQPVFNSDKIVIDENVITGDTVLTSANAGRLLRLQGASSAFTVSLPAIGTTDTFLTYFLVSDGGSHVNVTINVNTGGNIVFNGNKTQIILAQGERAMIVYTGTDYVVLNDCPGVLRVGEIFDIYDKDSSVQGCIFADGSLLDRNVYRRLWAFVQQLDASLLITDATWVASSEQHGRFSTGDGVTNFRIPRLYTTGYLRGVEGTGLTRLAGSYQDDDVESHAHVMFGEESSATNLEAGKIPAYLAGGYGAGNDYRIKNAATQTATRGITGSTGLETTPKNFGVYKMIRI